jgi:hypothetical protein
MLSEGRRIVDKRRRSMGFRTREKGFWAFREGGSGGVRKGRSVEVEAE